MGVFHFKPALINKSIPAESLKNRYPFWALAFVLCSAVVLLYSSSLGHNFLFDEENIILNNPTIRSFSQIPEMLKHGYFYFSGRAEPQWDEYYRPLTSLTLMIDYHFWGVNPLGYNLTNLFLHLVLCLLYFRLLCILLDHRLAAFFSAALYAVHTIHTEAVTYTASRGDILGMVLMLASMLFYVRRRPMVSLLCYALALFCKETMLLLPLYILILEIGFVKSPAKDLVKNTGPFFLAAAAFWLFRKYLCPIPFATADGDLRGMLLRMLGMGDGILQYLRALVAPEYFKPFSDVPVLYGFTDPLIWTAVTVAALLTAAWLLSLRTRGLAFVGMSIFLVGLAPHFQIMRVYPKWAEHFICISALGLFLLLGMLVRSLFEQRNRKALTLFFTFYAFFFCFISYRTWQRNEIYNDSRSYYKLLSETPTPYRFFGYQRLALESLREGRPDEAYVPLHAARSQEFRSESTHQLLGFYYQQKNQPEMALKEFKLAYFYSGGNSAHLPAIGATQVELGRYPQALKTYQLAHRISPFSVSPYIQMMSVYELLNQEMMVRRWAENGLKTFRDKPESVAPLLIALAKYEYRRGRLEAARAHLRRLIKECAGSGGSAELARFWLGQTTPEAFKRMSEERYPYYQKTLPSIYLAAAVLGGDRAAVLDILKEHRRALTALSAKNPLIERERRRALDFLLSR